MVVLYQLSYRGRTYTAADQPWSEQHRSGPEPQRAKPAQPDPARSGAASALGEASYSAIHRCVNGIPDNTFEEA